MATQTPSNGNWVAPGVPAIAKAENAKQARAAANQWLAASKDNAGTLAGASAYLLNKQVDASQLVSGGCATAKAVALTQELAVAIAASAVTPAKAPANATNSGTVNGAVVSYSSAGINGDRSAIKIVLRNGTVVWVLARCGNAVKPGPAPVPPGPIPGPGPKPKPTPHKKAPLSWQCQQNWHAGCPGTGKWRQDPQNNSTSGSNTGGTPGAPAQPHNPPYQPAPPAGHPAPNPNSGGYSSGGGTGSAPGGSSSNGGTTTGGGHPTPQNPPANSGQGGNNSGDPGGF